MTEVWSLSAWWSWEIGKMSLKNPEALHTAKWATLLIIGELIRLFLCICSAIKDQFELPVIRYSLLAVRIRNSWHPYEYKEYLDSIYHDSLEFRGVFEVLSVENGVWARHFEELEGEDVIVRMPR